MRVEVYWNIRKKEYSMRALTGPGKGRVIRRGRGFTLGDCELVVQQGGRKRVLRDGKKNVHAFIRGTWTPHTTDRVFPGSWWHNKISSRVRYNPYRDEQWNTWDGGERVNRATTVFLCCRDGHPIVSAVDAAWEGA